MSIETHLKSSKIIAFNKSLSFNELLPSGYRVLNPFQDNPETYIVMEQFYHKFYHDDRERKFIIGINPSRHGAGVTGVPFTDTKRLKSECGIVMHSSYTHEISSVFLYDVISAYGGPAKFYKDFYINSPFPLAIIRQNSSGKWLNANYYDDRFLFKAVENYMIETLRKHISIGLKTKRVYVLGKKNAQFIATMNRKANLFDEMVVLEHPRFIQQYRSKEKLMYIDKYILALNDSL